MKLGSLRSLPALLVAMSVWLASGSAHAFQSPARYLDPPEMGGGGGRLFTGSPIDRYTCKVCHTVGEPLDIQVHGLPVNGYMPGQSYRIIINWPATLKAVSFNIEMTDNAGRAAGAFSVPPMSQLTPADLCANGVPGVAAASAMAGPGMMARTLALQGECGSHQATFDWTAPMPGTDAESLRIGPDVWFSGSLVSADLDGTVIGDSVSDFSRVIGLRQNGAPAATEIKNGCELVRGPRASRLAPLAWLGVFALALGLRRRHSHGAPR